MIFRIGVLVFSVAEIAGDVRATVDQCISRMTEDVPSWLFTWVIAPSSELDLRLKYKHVFLVVNCRRYRLAVLMHCSCRPHNNAG